MSTRRPYSTDLSDGEWEILEPLVPDAKPGGRPRAHEPREILNAIFFYVLRGGCAWRLLPHDFFLPWQRPPTTTSGRGANGRHLGASYTHRPAREATRPAGGQGAYPERVAIIDSQTAKTTEKDAIRGYDGGGKKISTRKRHLLVDSTGFW